MVAESLLGPFFCMQWLAVTRASVPSAPRGLKRVGCLGLRDMNRHYGMANYTLRQANCLKSFYQRGMFRVTRASVAQTRL